MRLVYKPLNSEQVSLGSGAISVKKGRNVIVDLHRHRIKWTSVSITTLYFYLKM